MQEHEIKKQLNKSSRDSDNNINTNSLYNEVTNETRTAKKQKIVTMIIQKKVTTIGLYKMQQLHTGCQKLIFLQNRQNNNP